MEMINRNFCSGPTNFPARFTFVERDTAANQPSLKYGGPVSVNCFVADMVRSSISRVVNAILCLICVHYWQKFTFLLKQPKENTINIIQNLF